MLKLPSNTVSTKVEQGHRIMLDWDLSHQNIQGTSIPLILIAYVVLAILLGVGIVGGLLNAAQVTWLGLILILGVSINMWYLLRNRGPRQDDIRITFDGYKYFVENYLVEVHCTPGGLWNEGIWSNGISTVHGYSTFEEAYEQAIKTKKWIMKCNANKYRPEKKNIFNL